MWYAAIIELSLRVVRSAYVSMWKGEGGGDIHNDTRRRNATSLYLFNLNLFSGLVQEYFPPRFFGLIFIILLITIQINQHSYKLNLLENFKLMVIWSYYYILSWIFSHVTCLKKAIKGSFIPYCLFIRFVRLKISRELEGLLRSVIGLHSLIWLENAEV